MGDEQSQALERMLAEDEAFRAAITAAGSVDEAVRIAREHGIEVTVEDFDLSPITLSDTDLERASGGKYPSMDCEYTTPFDMRHQCGQG